MVIRSERRFVRRAADRRRDRRRASAVPELRGHFAFTLPKPRERFAFTVPELPGRSRAFTVKQREQKAFTLLPKLRGHFAFTLPKLRGHFAFTLIEILLVVAIIALVLGFLIPSLGPASGRSLDGATRQFVADLEGARLIAIAERTHTRVLIPTAENAQLEDNLAMRSYLITSLNKTAGNWKQRGKWNRLSQSVAFDPAIGIVDPTASPTPSPTDLDKAGNGTTSVTFTAPYIEFQANGSTSLDPTAPPQVVALADAFVAANGTFVAKNTKLRCAVTIDPLSGAVSVQ